MRRREFISIIGSVMAQPFAAGAQQQALPVIGFLSLRGAGGSDDLLAAFRNGLREAGFVEGQNVAIEYRWAEGRSDRLPAMVDQKEVAGGQDLELGSGTHVILWSHP